MTSQRFTRLIYCILMIGVSLQLMGCSMDDQPVSAPSSVASFPVDPTFKEFDSLLGGQQVLGPAISRLELRADNLQCQYTERALLCFNPTVTGPRRFNLYPLGKDLNIREDSHKVVGNGPDGAYVVDGFVIYEKFLPLYDQLYGATYVGRPLTELRINYDLNRVEQFFANVGFYQSLGDPNGPVFLIAYGAYLCGGTCSYQSEEYWFTVKSNLVEQPFAESIARLGGSGVFGTPILQPEVINGVIRQVYGNVIFEAPQDNLSQVSLYSLPADLGYLPEPLVAKTSHDQLIFFTLDQQSGLGHNVPRPFEQFLAQHGSTVLSGNPIQEIKQVAGQNLYRQCFEKLCLIYDPVASDSLKVRLAPLGKEYIKNSQYNPDLEVKNIFTPDLINLTIAVDRPNLSNTEEQYVRMSVDEKETGLGMARVEGTLVLNSDGRPPLRYNFPLTDAQGMSVVVIPAQPELENGTRLQYHVCLNLPSEQPICRQDNYLIWNTK